MKICIDVSAAVHHRAGIGRYTHELCRALQRVAPEHELIALYNRPGDAALDPPFDAWPQAALAWGDKPWRLRVMLAHLLDRSQVRLLPAADLFHAADHLLPHLPGISCAFTLYDLTFLLTQTHTLLNSAFLRLMVPRFLREASIVITLSESTKRDLLRHYDIPDSRIRIAYGGVDPSFAPAPAEAVAEARRRYGLPERFILSVGTIEPRKNLVTLLEAYRALLNRGLELGMVIVGKRGWRSRPFFERMKELGIEERVVLPGFVKDEDLPAVYTAADVFAYPSLYEGFGLPPLEAMACGTPVIVSDVSSLPEVVGTAGILIPPQDIQGWVECLAQVLEHPARHEGMRRQGLSQATGFSWDATARATLAAYEQALKGQPGKIPRHA